MLKKIIWANFQRIIELFTQKYSQRSLKYGFGIWDPRSGKKPISEPGSRGQKGTGSRIRNTDRKQASSSSPGGLQSPQVAVHACGHPSQSYASMESGLANMSGLFAHGCNLSVNARDVRFFLCLAMCLIMEMRKIILLGDFCLPV